VWHGEISVDPTDPTVCSFTATQAGSSYIICWEGPPYQGPKGSADIAVTQNGQQLDRIQVTPASVNLEVGEQQQFTARGYDTNGAPMDPPITPMWSTDGGSISQDGTYTAPDTEGDYAVTAEVLGSPVMGTANVQVTAPPQQLDRIQVTPASVNLEVGEQQQFTARGYDTNGDPMDPPITPSWSATGGAMSQGGGRGAGGAQQMTYTAGNLPGHYGVTASVGHVVGRSWVTVEGEPPPDLGPGQSHEHTFDTEGTYPYHDDGDPGQKGTAVVGATGGVLPPLGTTTIISITATGFQPLTVTIGVGDTVRWTNADAVTHSIRGGEPQLLLYLPLLMR
jgi:plastocyanin